MYLNVARAFEERIFMCSWKLR